jgi:hypothetical protein
MAGTLAIQPSPRDTDLSYLILSANDRWGAKRGCVCSVHSVTPVTPVRPLLPGSGNSPIPDLLDSWHPVGAGQVESRRYTYDSHSRQSHFGR